MFFYVGTYTSKKSRGIYLCKFNSFNGAISIKGLVASLHNPTYLALSAGGGYLYAVSENRDGGTRHDASVNAYRINRKTGGLTFINNQRVPGTGPCHVSVDSTSSLLLS